MCGYASVVRRGGARRGHESDLVSEKPQDSGGLTTIGTSKASILVRPGKGLMGGRICRFLQIRASFHAAFLRTE